MDQMPSSRTGGFNSYFDQPRKDVKEIESQMISIISMQQELAKAISNLTAASAINQTERTVVDAILYIKTFVSLSTGWAIMKTEQAVGIMSKNGFRATVIKNSSDFVSVTARRVTINRGVNEAIKSFGQIIALKNTEALARKTINNVANSSELSLYWDSLASSGKGTIDKLYAINNALNKEYNELALERQKLRM